MRVGAASGRDLTAWTTAWLDRSGTDTIRLVDGALRGDSDLTAAKRDRTASTSAASPSADDTLAHVATTPVETVGGHTEVELPQADLHLLNAGDLTFAAVRPGDASMTVLMDRAGDLPDPLSRSLARPTAWDMLVKGECSAADVVRCLTGALVTERSPIVVETFLALALKASEQWAPAGHIGGLLQQVADRVRGSPSTLSSGRPPCARSRPPRRRPTTSRR